MSAEMDTAGRHWVLYESASRLNAAVSIGFDDGLWLRVSSNDGRPFKFPPIVFFMSPEWERRMESASDFRPLVSEWWLEQLYA